MSEEKEFITEWANPNLGLTARITKLLHEEQSPFQHIQVAEGIQYGRMLILDGVFQTSVKDEFIYHEMIAHVPLMMHPCPERVLIIGGGDGGCAREVCRHGCVRQVDLCEIDEEVMETSETYFPALSSALRNPPEKLHIHVGDGIGYVKTVEDFYDVILVDCSDPVGPGEGLFTREFYKNASKALRAGGILVQQSESPILHQRLLHDIFQAMGESFPIVRTYIANIPIYPTGMHSFTMASKQYDPLTVSCSRPVPQPMKYYNSQIQKSAFVLPEFVKDCLYRGIYSF